MKYFVFLTMIAVLVAGLVLPCHGQGVFAPAPGGKVIVAQEVPYLSPQRLPSTNDTVAIASGTADTSVTVIFYTNNFPAQRWAFLIDNDSVSTVATPTLLYFRAWYQEFEGGPWSAKTVLDSIASGSYNQTTGRASKTVAFTIPSVKPYAIRADYYGTGTGTRKCIPKTRMKAG